MTTAKKKTTKVDKKADNIPAEAAPTLMELSLDLIDDPKRPMRKNLTPASVEDLVLSIKQVGIIEPLVVKAAAGRFEVIAGHRRLYAAGLAKLVTAPCIARTANDEETEMLKIHENLYRTDITPPEEADHYNALIQKKGLTPVKIAKIINRSPQYVLDRLAILNYPDFLSEALQLGHISFSVAKEFARFDDLKQMSQAVFYAKRGGMTGDLARKWVADHKRNKDRATIEEQSVTNEETGQQEVIHTTECIKCREAVGLIEAEMVYMHRDCLIDLNTPEQGG